jgi:ABC-type branched-subunit amino acid transport system substrate-binding protein
VHSSSRLAAAGALLGCLLAGCGSGSGPGSQPVTPTTASTARPPLRVLYVQAPLSGPAAGEGRAMLDAVRLVVDQHGGVAGRVRVVVRALDDGGRPPFATQPARCARNAAQAAADPAALAVIGTYELACSKRALQVLRPAGLWLVSPLNATDSLPGALRLAPSVSDEGAASAQLARALGAVRTAVVSRRPGAGVAFASSLIAAAAVEGADPVLELDASAETPQDIAGELRDAHIQVVALAGSPGTWSTDLLRELALLPKPSRPSVIAPETFDTLAFIGGAGAAAEGVRVISRLVPAEQLGGSARSFASAYLELHGQPPPVAAYAADAAEAVLAAAGSGDGSRSQVATALAALPAHDALLGRWAATPSGGITPRGLAVLVVDGGTFRVERVVSVSDPVPPSGDVK